MPLVGQPVGMRLVACGMLRENTPVEDYLDEYGLWVKREDLACPAPGPAFSKTRGVYARVASRAEKVIGALDTYHSQAGHAVARACQVLGKKCLNFYPEFKYEPGPRPPQIKAKALGAELRPLPAGRSAILFHAARKAVEAEGGYMMPNALKLNESVDETAREARATTHPSWEDVGSGPRPPWVLIPSSSATIAAGVIKGFGDTTDFIIHLGYSRSHDEVRRYVEDASGVSGIGRRIVLVDEGYAYKDKAVDGPTPPWPCNDYYDLKAFRWWMREGRYAYGEALLWNIG